MLYITGEYAEYWDNTGSAGFSYTYQSLEALVTGTTSEIKEDEQHGEVNLLT